FAPAARTLCSEALAALVAPARPARAKLHRQSRPRRTASHPRSQEVRRIHARIGEIDACHLTARRIVDPWRCRGGSIHNGGAMLAGIEKTVITRRKRVASERPWVTLKDAKLAIALPLLWAFAVTVPERRWRTLCHRLESIRARVNIKDLE